MPAIHETAYPRIKPNLSSKELKEVFTPTEEELFLLDSKTKKTLPVTRLGFMLALKYYQYLGRPIKPQKIDATIKKYLAEKMGINPLIDLTGYSKLTRHRHMQSIREYLQINADKQARRRIMKAAALDAATKKENLADIINCVIEDLNCGDAYVPDAFIYDDPNKQLISWDEFNTEVDGYCDLVKLPKEQGKFIDSLKNRLRQTAKKVDECYPNNPHLIIEQGLPILKKLTKKKDHPDLDRIRQLIMDEMPIKTIVDVIIELENWFNLSVYFKPHSGYETKIPDYPPRFVATSLSYGCNMGPTQTERSLLKYTRKQIAWLFNHHVTDLKLIKVINVLINHYNTFGLPKYWGSGDSLSVDGTFWDMYTQNLLAAHHIRYGRYGGVGYYHVSDQYIALFSNFISCGAHESVYLLDGVVENDSDIQPKKVHGDSWAQSEVLFGVASLLAITIMPRIKQFKHLNYYKASANDHYDNINELFTEKPIDWELIETHYHDMLRVAISIQKGKIKASTVLHKLCSKSRKNKLYFAFRELGRVERSIFLLNYINDPEMRRMIQAATCKSEEFNQFISWIRFGGGGVISDNMRPNQRKIIRFNHLLANMLIFHTVVYQTKGINKLRAAGIEIPDEVLPGISPYWTEHLNRFGTFHLDMQKIKAEIEYDLIAPDI